MSTPSFENIDRWFFEYTEGNLSVVQESQLMDFLTIHPELMPELKAWNSAKVKAPVHQPFASNHLVKATPLLLRPFSLVSIGVFAIAFAWLGFSLYPSIPLYSMTTIDADVINVEEEEDLFIEQLLAMTNNAKLEKEISISKVNRDAAFNTSSISKADYTENKNYNLDRSEIASVDVQTIHKVKNKQNSYFINSETKEGDEVYNQGEFYTPKNLTAKVNDLVTISDYLNNKEQILDEPFIDRNLTINRSSRTASSKKSSLKNSLSKTIRKIKRMADYPVALQNTKNPHYHVPMMTGFNSNFAMVGTAPGNRIQATSRMQWLNESNSQLMNSLSWDGYIYALRGGLGVDVNYNNYQNGDLNNYSTAITYSPKLSINKKISFEPAVRFKMGVVNLDQQADIIGNEIELDRTNIIPLFQNESQVTGHQMWYHDFGLGFMINTEWFYAGLDADNIGRHDNNFYSSDLNKSYKSDFHYTAVIGTEYASKTRKLRLSGYGLYQNYGSLNEIWLGVNFKYNWMQIGAAASSNGDLASSLGVIFDHFDIHYNIDFTESRLLNKQFLSHQVTLKILLKPSRYVAKFLNL